jgi:hypothetical protein
MLKRTPLPFSTVAFCKEAANQLDNLLTLLAFNDCKITICLGTTMLESATVPVSAITFGKEPTGRLGIQDFGGDARDERRCFWFQNLTTILLCVNSTKDEIRCLWLQGLTRLRLLLLLFNSSNSVLIATSSPILTLPICKEPTDRLTTTTFYTRFPVVYFLLVWNSWRRGAITNSLVRISATGSEGTMTASKELAWSHGSRQKLEKFVARFNFCSQCFGLNSRKEFEEEVANSFRLQ